MELNLKNFCNFDELKANFEPGLNIISSDLNASGKTTVKCAIEYALTGRAADKDVTDFIPISNPNLTPTVKINNIVGFKELSRTVNPNTLLADLTMTKVDSRKLKDPIEDLGIKTAVISFLVNGCNFFLLPPEKQYDILANYISSQKPIVIKEYYPDLSQDNLKELPETVSTGTIDSFYKKYFEERTDVNRTCLAAENENKTLEEQYNSESKDSLVEDVKKLEATKKELLKEPAFPTELTEPLYSKINEIMESKTLSAEFKTKEKELEDIKKIGVSNKTAYEKIEENTSKPLFLCPIANIPCSSVDELKEYASTKKEETNKLRKKAVEINNFIIQTKEEEEIEVNKIKFIINEIELKNKTEKEDIANKNKIIEADNKTVEISISALSAKINNLENLSKQIAKNKITISNAIDRKEKLEKYIQIFGKDGLKTKIISKAGSGFWDDVNKSAKEFGFKFEVINEPKFSLKINGKTNKMMSEAERIMSSISIQFAIAKMSEYNFVLVDRADCLDSENLKKLCEVAKANKEIITILAGTSLAKRIDESFESIKIEKGLVFYGRNK